MHRFLFIHVHSLFILFIKNFQKRWKWWVTLINNKVKLINIARLFAKVSLAISFFGSSCLRDVFKKLFCVRKNTFKLPVNSGNFTKKKTYFQAFLGILSISRFLGLFKSFVSSRSQLFYKIGIPKYSEAANGVAL